MRMIRILIHTITFFSIIAFIVAVLAPFAAQTRCGCVEKLTSTHYVDLCLYTDAWLCWWNPNGQGSFPFDLETFEPKPEAKAWDPEPYEDPVVYFDVLGLRAGKDELDNSILSKTKYVVVPHWLAMVATGFLPLVWPLICWTGWRRRKAARQSASADEAAKT